MEHPDPAPHTSRNRTAIIAEPELGSLRAIIRARGMAVMAAHYGVCVQTLAKAAAGVALQRVTAAHITTLTRSLTATEAD